MLDLNQYLRPTSWEDVIGQSDVKEICQKNLSEGKFPKFSIFYGPTGTGKSCIAELIARKLVSCEGSIENCASIKKINMASLSGKKDIVEIIDSIFKYKSVVSNAFVYILEEVQILKQIEEQTPFLEELTHIPDNVYIIMCTTKISALTPELRNRAIAFQLTLPSFDDCVQLVENVMEKLNFRPMSKKAMSILIQASNNTPRSIIKHIELLASQNAVSDEDVIKFFKTVSTEYYIRTLNSLADEKVTLYEMVNIVTPILKECAVQNFMYGFRDFVIQYLIECASKQQLILMSRQERELVNSLLGMVNESAFARIFDQLNKSNFYNLTTVNETLACLIKIKLFMQQKTVVSVLKSNNASASEAVIANKKAAATRVFSSTKEQVVSIDANTSLTEFGIEDGTLYEEQ